MILNIDTYSGVTPEKEDISDHTFFLPLDQLNPFKANGIFYKV